MKNRPEKNIDELFRYKLLEGENHIEFQDSDWKDLEAKLDPPQKSVSRVWIYSAAAAILVAGILVWYFVGPAARTSNRTVVQNEQHHQLHPVAPKPEKKILPEAENRTESSNPGHPTGQSSTSSKTESRAVGSLTEKKKNERIPISRFPGNNVRIPRSTLPPVVFSEPPAIGGPLPVTEGKQNSMTKRLAKQRKTHINVWNGLTVSLLGASDLNGVGSFQSTSIGGDVGLLLSAHVFDRWSISTGAIYAKKPYTIGYNQYYSANGYQSQSQPNKVHADCRVLDIPVNVNYSLWERKGNKIGMGMGLSSYLMLREKYYFQYLNSSGMNSKEINIVNQNRHWFSVLNFQLSYEKQISSDLSIGFEPYVKLPLRNIGYEKVKLQSAGLAVVINWRVLSGK